MKITLISVGKLKEKYLREGIAEYSKRLSRYCSLEMIEVSDEKCPESLSDADKEIIKNKEGDRITSKLKEGTYLITLEIEGKELSSEKLASRIEKVTTGGNSHLTFLIGGSLGLSDNLKRRTDFALSFSKLTFPHQMMKLILLEQIYRSFRIIRNEPYHK
ncbi:23S rRNA (pseudouridine(1915)-N(3))-methyltransferase RlmH [Spirochaeta isovalerica]|uniref:Ribosomal RNA large subunit methyltransferase H n=1 Tax=Spirochaeta isovalerica TaxID=150 RepID=A0A841R762_9SPIO|nr:23S rRNA (pseudouridine(1915)-N(3))-methyltransferase RlmH [Spirochaeta isovalerica]MBB6478880.1 23S rRNA (pseudouridine1915-N3)-methyltransferase [Spirochaeta isovalerica]